MRRTTFVFFFALLAALLLIPQAQAAPRERCFSETGFCVSGVLLDYWERNGGLPVFGYPIGPQQIETVEGTWTGPVQWFERDRLEDHSNERKGVLAGRLGARYLELTGRPWKQGNEANRPGAALCTKFDTTGYNVCAPFSHYWSNNGGLERFGYPITPAFEETVEGKTYLVQYFERRRMEYHPENKDPKYQILLGLLGRDVRQLSGGTCDVNAGRTLNYFAAYYQGQMQCPSAKRDSRIVTQYYQRGQMLWVPGDSGSAPTIYVIVPNTTTGTIAWSKFTDTYREGERVDISDVPPAGLYAPVRGFGKLWWGNPVLREALGWAAGNETPEDSTILIYNQHDGRIMERHNNGTVDILLPNGEYTQSGLRP